LAESAIVSQGVVCINQSTEPDITTEPSRTSPLSQWDHWEVMRKLCLMN